METKNTPQYNIMVCVTGQKTCERLINRASERARHVKNPNLHVVHCVQTDRHFMNSIYEADAIEYLFTASQLAGGDLVMLKDDNVEDTLVNYALTNDVRLLIMGASPPGENTAETIGIRLQRRLPNVEFDIL